jgi:hypothetical protein
VRTDTSRPLTTAQGEVSVIKILTGSIKKEHQNKERGLEDSSQ